MLDDVALASFFVPPRKGNIGLYVSYPAPTCENEDPSVEPSSIGLLTDLNRLALELEVCDASVPPGESSVAES